MRVGVSFSVTTVLDHFIGVDCPYTGIITFCLTMAAVMLSQ